MGRIGAVLGLAKFVGEPIQAFVQTVALDRTGGLDVPLKHNIHLLVPTVFFY